MFYPTFLRNLIKNRPMPMSSCPPLHMITV